MAGKITNKIHNRYNTTYLYDDTENPHLRIGNNSLYFPTFYAERQKIGALHALKFKIHGAIFAE